MKKILMLATTVMLSTTAIAGNEDTFYIKANIGANLMNKISKKQNLKDQGLKVIDEVKIKNKAKATPLFILGAGYYLMDNVRADLSLEMVSSPNWKGSFTKAAPAKAATTKAGEVATDTTTTEAADYAIKNKVKGSAGALMANVYVDMFDVSIIEVFAGAGVGVARVKEKHTTTITHEDKTTDYVYSSKNKTNLAYQLTIGAAAEVAPGVKAELAYSWRDYGKGGKFKDKADKNKQIQIANARFRGHSVIAGVRFDL